MIKIICIGKIKENFYREAINEYLKRLSKYTKMEIIELNDLSFDKEKTIKEESKSIINKLDNGYNILLDINGESLDSISFSKKINDLLIDNHHINFIIGGSYGVSDELKTMVNYRLSFSKMTFPHQLFRVVLLEQIYRAFKIMNNEEYHK
ncbi:MAG: 23S rRNA (pseudouridine(1915)-N(3))-methyltransferase RlmH [Bacilli bacterium]|nr:23S rRNA (pseudouridine(1915)-N(3))-methyltransferase RlmH [Bacilli bacterium]